MPLFRGKLAVFKGNLPTKRQIYPIHWVLAHWNGKFAHVSGHLPALLVKLPIYKGKLPPERAI